MQIYDSVNKQWLEPMIIYFGKDNTIWRVDACVPGDDPLSDGWYSFMSDDLDKIAIVGNINHNTELLP